MLEPKKRRGRGGRRPNSGRPVKPPEERRERLVAYVLPATAQAMKDMQTAGETTGEIIDRLVSSQVNNTSEEV